MQLPGINKHALSLGGSLQMSRSISMNLAAVYAFRNSISGSILEVPGTSVTLDQDVTSLVAGKRNLSVAPERGNFGMDACRGV